MALQMHVKKLVANKLEREKQELKANHEKQIQEHKEKHDFQEKVH